MGAQQALRRVLLYMPTHPDVCVEGFVGEKMDLQFYCDSDHAGDTTVGTNRSHTGLVILLNGMPIHWKSNKQPITSYSSACAEIYAMSECCREARLIAWVAEEMGRQVPYPIVLQVDNAAGVSYQHSTCSASKLRGVYDQRKDWIQELKNQAIVTAVKVDTAKNLADLLTKCHSVTTRKRLQQELERIAGQVSSAYSTGGT